MRVVHVHSSLVLPRVPRRAALGLAAAGSLAFGVAVADAHTEVASTSPSSGGTASTPLHDVEVTFTGQIRRGTITVTRSGKAVSKSGKTVSRGKGGKDPRNVKRLKVGLKSGLKPGKYTAKWTAVAADGHEQSGSFTFRLKKR